MPALLLLVVALTLLLCVASASRRRRRRRLPLPPGPRGLPIIGNMLMINQLTHRGLAKLADEYGGLVHLRLGSLHAVAVSTPEMARQVLHVQDSLFCDRPATIAISYLTYGLADMSFAPYGPLWRQMRKLCVTKLLSRSRVQSWAVVRDEVDATVAAAAAGGGRGAVRIGEMIFNLTMNITFRAAFGVATSADEQAEFVSILLEISKLFGAFNAGDFLPSLNRLDLHGINKRLRRARASLDGFINRIIDEHTRNPKDVDADMVDHMLAHTNESVHTKLSMDNIKAIIMDVMFGGTDAVGCSIEWALAELVRNPDEMKRVQRELAGAVGLERKVEESDLDALPYLNCVVKETLRLHPPIPLLLHQTTRDCEVAGYCIPGKSRVMVNVFAIGRDKAAWGDPDEFRPSRFAGGGVDLKGSCFEFIPFGSGRRSCPGRQIGVYTMELALAQLVHCFTWELPGGVKPGELDMADVFGLTAPMAVRLVAVPTPRLSCSLF